VTKVTRAIELACAFVEEPPREDERRAPEHCLVEPCLLDRNGSAL
jgi:hypothetical protein